MRSFVMITLTKIEQQIADILVAAALKGKTITFAEIMQKAGISRRCIGEYLSHIGHKCQELGLSIITSIVVYKIGGKVGKGYKEFDPNYTQKSVEEEQKRVFSQTSWNGLSQPVAAWTNDIMLNDALNLPKTSAIEGETIDRQVTVYKRDARLRKECLEKNGHVCSICGFDPATKYGKGFENIIEVHHVHPVACGTRETTLDDLIPVCPNCHRALHSKGNGDVYEPNEIEQLIKGNTKVIF